MLKFIHLKAGEKMIHESLKKIFQKLQIWKDWNNFATKRF